MRECRQARMARGCSGRAFPAPLRAPATSASSVEYTLYGRKVAKHDCGVVQRRIIFTLPLPEKTMNAQNKATCTLATRLPERIQIKIIASTFIVVATVWLGIYGPICTEFRSTQAVLKLQMNTAITDSPQMKPNILFIVMDDLGSNDLGLHGSGIKTPISDSLAREGLYLNNYYVLPTCTMTRIALMTGRYPYRMGQYDVIRAPQERGMPVDEETLPQVLRRAGYQTHAIGKWHLGHAKYEQLPTFRGFKSFFGFHVGGAQDYFSHISRNDAYDMRWEKHEFCGEDCSEIVDERGNYSSHIFGREAVRVVNEHESSTGPLFLYLAFQAVHFPLEVPDEYVELYDDTNWDTTRKYYAGMLTAADEAIGQVKLAMEKRGLWKDTLVVFTTDNGGAVKGKVIKGTDRRERGQVASNYPYRGGKKDVWEGGVAGDGFISGPAMQSLAMLHGKSDGLFHAVDWLPTLADLSGVLQIGKPMDGVSQLQALRKGDTARNTTFLGYSAQPPYNTTENSFTAVRQGKWKLVREPNREIFNLFDLETDPEERQDLSASFPWIVTHLQKSMEDFESLFSPSVESFDERCPTLSFTNTSWGQKSWHPWCG